MAAVAEDAEPVPHEGRIIVEQDVQRPTLLPRKTDDGTGSTEAHDDVFLPRRLANALGLESEQRDRDQDELGSHPTGIDADQLLCIGAPHEIGPVKTRQPQRVLKRNKLMRGFRASRHLDQRPEFVSGRRSARRRRLPLTATVAARLPSIQSFRPHIGQTGSGAATAIPYPHERQRESLRADERTPVAVIPPRGKRRLPRAASLHAG